MPFGIKCVLPLILYVMLTSDVNGFFQYCEVNQTLFVPEGSSATFSAAADISFLRSYFIKYNKTSHLVFSGVLGCCDNATIINNVYFSEPWIENRTQITGNSTSIKIIIDDIEKADNGTYVLHLLGQQHCFALVVLGIHRQPVGSIEENRPAYFYAYPKASLIRHSLINATMIWLIDGKNITESPQFVLQDGMIWIASVSRVLDGKNITYRAVQDNGVIIDVNYTVDVTYGPEAPLIFTPNKAQYFLNSGKTMPDVSCNVDCSPPCTVSWENSSKSNSLSLGKVTSTSSGEYICKAKRPDMDIVVTRSLIIHIADEKAWEVQLSPNKTIYFLSAGDTVPEITCSANCIPPCEVSWGINSNSGKLILGVASTDMSGEYTCSARRNDSNRHATGRITVFVQDNTAFTVAIAALASIQAVTTLLLGLCGLCVYRRHNKSPCQTCMKSSKPLNACVKTESSDLENKGVEIEMEHYEDLDTESRSKPPVQNYEHVETAGKSPKKVLEIYENTKLA